MLHKERWNIEANINQVRPYYNRKDFKELVDSNKNPKGGHLFIIQDFKGIVGVCICNNRRRMSAGTFCSILIKKDCATKWFPVHQVQGNFGCRVNIAGSSDSFQPERVWFGDQRGPIYSSR